MVVLRFAPSPTGYLHVGNVRTALINFLFAQTNQGRFLLRFDDTDTERSQNKFKEAILEDLDWLGWSFDPPFYQSERLALYDKAVETLKKCGRLYPCYETPEELDFKRKRLLAAGRPPVYDRSALSLRPDKKAAYEAEGRIPHWRFRLEDRTVSWEDLARGPLSYESTALSDPILIRANGSYVYTLCSVVDDLDTGITHIIRGNDHISNTAVQIQLTQALGGAETTFQFAHLPLLMGSKGESLSKRLGSLSIQDLRRDGIEAMALNSYLSQLGSSQDLSPQKNLKALIDSFSLKAFSANSPKFSLEDLERLNGRLLKALSFKEVHHALGQKGLSHIDEAFWLATRENISILKDLETLWSIVREPVKPIIEEGDKNYIALALTHLPSSPWDETTWKTWTDKLKQETERKGKALFMPLRRALTAQNHGPEMKKILPLIGKKRTRERLAGNSA